LKVKNIFSKRNLGYSIGKNKLGVVTSLSLSITTIYCTLNGLCAAGPVPPASQAASQTAPQGASPAGPQESEKKNTATQTEFAKGQIYTKGLGLTPVDLRLVNQGRFADLANKLSAKVSSAKVTRSSAWLAFAYLYLQKCDDLNQLANSYTLSPTAGNSGTPPVHKGGVGTYTCAAPSTDIDINLTLIKTFAYLCEKKLDLADKELQKNSCFSYE